MLKIYKLFIFISLITISKLTYSQINVDILTQVDSSFISKDTISICAENVIGLYANVSGGTSPYTYDLVWGRQFINGDLFTIYNFHRLESWNIHDRVSSN
ncbi:MAG: hypothetical protein ACOCG3_00590 [Rikenellaceae bacterium MAG02]|nr:hypothetical protein [Bacteroidales bacterium]